MAPDFPISLIPFVGLSNASLQLKQAQMIMFASEGGNPERIVGMMSLLQTSGCVFVSVLSFLNLCNSLSLSRPIRNPGEDTKMLVCDMCDKGYHTFCLQPAMDSLPTNGWRCKVGKDESLCPCKCFRAATHERESNASRDQSVFSNNLPLLILADSDQQYSHAILL